MQMLASRFVFSVVLLLSACGGDDVVTAEEQFFIDRANRNLSLGTTWLITEGIPVYRASGRDGLFRHLLDSLGVQLWVDPSVDKNGALARFNIRAKGIHHHVECVYRAEASGQYFEFWIDKISGASWTNVEMRTVFFVTKTDDTGGPREILLQSDQFIESYEDGQGIKIDFPQDNLRLLYDMEPWNYRNSYKNSDLDDRRVVFRDGVPQFE